MSVKEFEYHKILLNGKLYEVGLKWIGKDRLSIKLDHRTRSVELHGNIVLVDGKQYELQVNKIDKENYLVKSPKRRYRAKILIPTIPKRKVYQTQPVDYKIPIGEKTVVEKNAVIAPMAGSISSVKVKVGDTVKEGDVILTLNAMKMENEICATKSGKVKEIIVQKGSSVRERDPLVVIY